MRGLATNHVTSGSLRGLPKKCTQLHKRTDGHGDSMTESADSVKINPRQIGAQLQKYGNLGMLFSKKSTPCMSKWHLIRSLNKLLQISKF